MGFIRQCDRVLPPARRALLVSEGVIVEVPAISKEALDGAIACAWRVRINSVDGAAERPIGHLGVHVHRPKLTVHLKSRKAARAHVKLDAAMGLSPMAG